MANHHSDSSAADEIYRILPMFPMFVGSLPDGVTAGQDRPAAEGQKADTAELWQAERGSRACIKALRLVEAGPFPLTSANL